MLVFLFKCPRIISVHVNFLACVFYLCVVQELTCFTWLAGIIVHFQYDFLTLKFWCIALQMETTFKYTCADVICKAKQVCGIFSSLTDLLQKMCDIQWRQAVVICAPQG